MAFNKFKRREPVMDREEREIWNVIQAKLNKLGFDNASINPIDIMFAREPLELLWELNRFEKTTMHYKAKDTGSKPAYSAGIMNLDPVGMT